MFEELRMDGEAESLRLGPERAEARAFLKPWAAAGPGDADLVVLPNPDGGIDGAQSFPANIASSCIEVGLGRSMRASFVPFLYTVLRPMSDIGHTRLHPPCSHLALLENMK